MAPLRFLIRAAPLALLLACSSSSTSASDAGGVDTGLARTSSAQTAASSREAGATERHDAAAADGGRPSTGWGCADNGTECLCYAPAPAGYTATSCASTACCFLAEYVSKGAAEHECECVTTTPCATTNTNASKVSSCPPTL